MSDREFENYLNLLGGMLRLSRRQREDIAQELRSHLDERLEDLLASGCEETEAKEIALREFGDVAGLASQFVSIKHQQRRTWIMRVTTTSIIAATLVIIVGMAFWPATPSSPMGSVGAQDAAADPANPFGNGPAAAEKKAPATRKPAMETVEQRNAKTEEVLASPTQLEFDEASLTEILEYVSQSHELAVHVNRIALEELGVTSDSTVTMNMSDVRLGMGLELVLHEIDPSLVYAVRDGIIIITTTEDLENTNEVMIHDCRDLITSAIDAGDAGAKRARRGSGGMMGMGMGGGMEGMEDGMMGGFGGDMDGGYGEMGGMPAPTVSPKYQAHTQKLIQIITTTVEPQSWEDAGGPGTISDYQGLLIVNHNAHAHRKIEKVLEMLRAAIKKQPKK